MNVQPDLIKILDYAIQFYDFSIIEVLRSVTRQHELWQKGRKLKHPSEDPYKRASWVKIGSTVTNIDGYEKTGKHNLNPPEAFDIYPYPIDLSNDLKTRARFYYMAGIVMQCARELYAKGEIEHVLRWGGDWDQDSDFTDQTFDDLPHFELYKP